MLKPFDTLCQTQTRKVGDLGHFRTWVQFIACSLVIFCWQPSSPPCPRRCWTSMALWSCWLVPKCYPTARVEGGCGSASSRWLLGWRGNAKTKLRRPFSDEQFIFKDVKRDLFFVSCELISTQIQKPQQSQLRSCVVSGNSWPSNAFHIDHCITVKNCFTQISSNIRRILLECSPVAKCERRYYSYVPVEGVPTYDYINTALGLCIGLDLMVLWVKLFTQKPTPLY